MHRAKIQLPQVMGVWSSIIHCSKIMRYSETHCRLCELTHHIAVCYTVYAGIVTYFGVPAVFLIISAPVDLALILGEIIIVITQVKAS